MVITTVVVFIVICCNTSTFHAVMMKRDHKRTKVAGVSFQVLTFVNFPFEDNLKSINRVLQILIA